MKQHVKSYVRVSLFPAAFHVEFWYILGSEGLVVHEEELDISGVVNQESFVAGWHHVASFLVGAKSDLQSSISPGAQCPQSRGS
jgi:hypothetical protein